MINGVLLDLGGVVYVGEDILPGAAEAIEKLHLASLPVRFVTNTTRSPAEAILLRLRHMGLDIPPASLFTAPMAARTYLERHALRPFTVIHPDLEPEFADLRAGPPNAVLIGDAAHWFTYERLNRAFRLLMEGAPLLAMGRTRYFMEADGLSLDLGPFVTALEHAAGVSAIVLGKPARGFFEAAVASLGCPASRVVVIGDDVESDVAAALDAGLRAILVQTGKYRAGDEERVRGRNAIVLPDVDAAVRWVLEHR